MVGTVLRQGASPVGWSAEHKRGCWLEFAWHLPVIPNCCTECATNPPPSSPLPHSRPSTPSPQDDLRLLCPDGGCKTVEEFEECYIAKSPAYAGGWCFLLLHLAAAFRSL